MRALCTCLHICRKIYKAQVNFVSPKGFKLSAGCCGIRCTFFLSERYYYCFSISLRPRSSKGIFYVAQYLFCDIIYFFTPWKDDFDSSIANVLIDCTPIIYSIFDIKRFSLFEDSTHGLRISGLPMPSTS